MRGRTLGIKAKSFAPRAASYRSCRGVCGDCVGDERCGGCWPWGCRRARAFASRAGLPQKLPGGACGDCVAEVLCGGCCARGCQRARALAPRAGLPQKLRGGMRRLRRRIALRRMLGVGSPKSESIRPEGGPPTEAAGVYAELRRRRALRWMLCAGSPEGESIRPEGGPPTEAAGVYAEIASQKCVAADVVRGVAKELEHSPRGRASHKSCEVSPRFVGGAPSRRMH